MAQDADQLTIGNDPDTGMVRLLTLKDLKASNYPTAISLMELDSISEGL